MDLSSLFSFSASPFLPGLALLVVTVYHYQMQIHFVLKTCLVAHEGLVLREN